MTRRSSAATTSRTTSPAARPPFTGSCPPCGAAG
nr:MAG TPA: hypothetical protein [Caudoviricetes sp.]